MKIYSSSGSPIPLLDVSVSDESTRYRRIMRENDITLIIQLPEYVDIPVGSYVIFMGETYTLLKPQNFKKNNTRDFEYTLILSSSSSLLGRYKFKDLVYAGGIYGGSRKLKFSLTATPREHLQMLVDNLNERAGVLSWSIGTCITASEKTISYNHTYCNDAINTIADTFKTEFEIINKQISLHKVEYNKTMIDALPLSYGFGSGFKSGIRRDNFDQSKAVELLFIQGGDRNIDFGVYGSNELLLPKSQTLKYDGLKFEDETGFDTVNYRQYSVDALGYSIQRTGIPLVTHSEDSLDCSHIYPSRVGTVTSVIMTPDPTDPNNRDKDMCDFIDLTIPEALNYSQYRIDGEKATVIFQSGMLAGKEFDIVQEENTMSGYIHASRRFKLVQQIVDGLPMPTGNFIPHYGDTYAVFGISLPSAYVRYDPNKTGASWDMFREAVKYMYDNETDKFSFTGDLDPNWSKENWITLNLGGRIRLGGYVKFTDSQFQTDPVLIRIVGIRDYINDPYTPQIELSNVTVSGQSVGGALAEIPSIEVMVEDTNRKTIQFAKRGFRAAQATAKMLEDALLAGFTDKITPVTINTMQLLLGTESLQFRFVDDTTTPSEVPHVVSFNNNTGTLTAAAGIIQHLTMGISIVSTIHPPSAYKYWNMASFTDLDLNNDTIKDIGYYLYAKVNRFGADGTFILSPTAIGLNEDASFYHLLMGVLTSVIDGARSYSQMYGYAEMSPARLVINAIQSGDASTIINLVTGTGKFANGAISWDENGNAFFAGNVEATSGFFGLIKLINSQIVSDNFLISDSPIEKINDFRSGILKTINAQTSATTTLSAANPSITLETAAIEVNGKGAVPGSFLCQYQSFGFTGLTPNVNGESCTIHLKLELILNDIVISTGLFSKVITAADPLKTVGENEYAGTFENIDVGFVKFRATIWIDEMNAAFINNNASINNLHVGINGDGDGANIEWTEFNIRTKIAANGFYSYKNSTRYLFFRAANDTDDCFEIRLGNYGLQISQTGAKKMTNGMEWIDL